MEQQKERELGLQRDKKMLLLSLSHDIKTPLSAIKMYSKALSKGLYTSPEKHLEIAENINAKALPTLSPRTLSFGMHKNVPSNMAKRA